MGALDGIRVVEVGMWVAAPAAGGLMADWGADVIKVEPAAGDPFRSIFATLGFSGDLPNPPFALDNRGKRSVVVDVGQPAGLEVVDRLVATADVFLTNLRPDARERLGIDPARLMAANPRLVYASVSGYGLEGPDRDRPAYDVGAFYARSGIASQMTTAEGAPPGMRGGMGDHVTGLAALTGILAALFERERTGCGQLVDTSLMGTGMYTLGWDLGIQLAMGKVAGAAPREASASPLVNSYRTADGRWFVLIALEGERHWSGLLTAIGRPDLADDPDYSSQSARMHNRLALIAILDGVFAARTLDEWAAVFDHSQVWWSPVRTPAEVVADEQAIAAGAFVEIAGTDGLRSVAPPVTFVGKPPLRPGPVPRLGQHTEAVLAELGYDADTTRVLH